MTPTCLLATLCLNEMEWLPRLYRQHASWPGMAAWCFVEAADRMYAQANPNLVTSSGLSVDGTTEWLMRLGMESQKVLHYRYGLATHEDPAQGKCHARNVYLQLADRIKPDFIIVIDADEFYTRADQIRLMEYLRLSLKVRKGRPNPNHWGHMLRQRHVWYPPCYRYEPMDVLDHSLDCTCGHTDCPARCYKYPDLFSQEVVGGYWKVAHCRVWRWQPGMRHVHNHNAPQTQDGYVMNRGINRLNRIDNMPECVHMGFASSLASRTAKSSYYVARGEGRESGRTLNRQMYVDCRGAWTGWQPGVQLPHGAKVVPYTGPVPEVFQEHSYVRSQRPRGVNELRQTPAHAAGHPGVEETDRPDAGGRG